MIYCNFSNVYCCLTFERQLMRDHWRYLRIIVKMLNIGADNRSTPKLREKVLKYIFSSLCFLPAVWATEMSHTVKQPIRAELNIEPRCKTANQSKALVPRCKTANQSRAQHWAALWNSQSEQSSTLLFMTLPNKVITDHLILGTNSRGVNGHVKLFLEIFCPYLSHIPSMWI